MKKFSYFILLLLFIASCKRYEEGPDFTLRAIYNRIKGVWIPSKVLINNIDSVNFNTIKSIEFILCNDESICVPIWDEIYDFGQSKTCYINMLNPNDGNIKKGRARWNIYKDNFLVHGHHLFYLMSMYDIDSLGNYSMISYINSPYFMGYNNDPYNSLVNYNIKKLTKKEFVVEGTSIKGDNIRLEFKKEK